jgi:hypothetical protein
MPVSGAVDPLKCLTRLSGQSRPHPGPAALATIPQPRGWLTVVGKEYFGWLPADWDQQ